MPQRCPYFGFALLRLIDDPGPAVKLLRDRLQPARPAQADELRRLLADLDDLRFDRREDATKRLAQWGDLAESALKEASQGPLSPETRRRIESLLAQPPLVRAPEDRRHLRAIRALEAIGSPEARRLLESLSGGAPGSRLTREARAALARLARRPTAGP